MKTAVIILVIFIAIALAIAAFIYYRRRRTRVLQKQFGPEYKHAVRQLGDQRKAEAELTAREKRVHKLHVRSLTAEERARFTHQWKKAQAHFVDEPSPAVQEADSLVKEVMETRGYPIGDFDQRAADISVDYPNVVANYRSARDIAQRNKRGAATTEDLRQAMVHYRDLFEELLETETTTPHKEAV